MLKELYERIAEHVAAAQKPHVFDVPGVTSKRLLSRYPDTELVEIPLEPEDRRHRVLRVEDLGTWADEHSVTWVGRAGVVVVMNDKGLRGDRISLDLHPSSQIEALTSLPAQGLPHRPFVQFIRLFLRKELDVAFAGLYTMLCTAKVKHTRQTHSQVSQGQDAFGEDISAEAMGLSDAPETIILRLPMWRELDIKIDLTCELVINAAEQTFAIVPQGDALDRAWESALEILTEQVKGEVEGVVCQGTY